jgi:hypothetical protein
MDRIPLISGSHYSRAPTAHSMIHEVLMFMMFEAFRTENPEKEMEVKGFVIDFQSINFGGEVWNATKELVDATEEDFELYLK